MLHRRDHEHGGTDTVRIVYESVGGAGSGGGIRFETDPQAGEWLLIEVDGSGGPHGYAFELDAPSGDGISVNGIPVYLGDVEAASGGAQLFIQGNGVNIALTVSQHLRVHNGYGGPVVFDVSATGAILMPSLPTTNPGVTGALWNDAGTVKIS